MTDDDLAAQRGQLYAADPSEFVSVRKELSTAAKKAGDPELAKRITALRKPTAAAAIVNRFVLADDTVLPRVHDLGDQLRRAQGDPDGIDARLLRELSAQRRTFVHDLTAAAVDASGASPGAATRDEVQQTLDAAVADPDVAARLGHLTRAEQWSGFGTVAVSGSARKAEPKPAAKSAAKSADKPKRSTRAGGSPSAQRALSKAEQALSEADDRVTSAEQDDASARERVDELTARVEQAQHELDEAERNATQARRALRTAHAHRREAEATRRRAARETQE